VHFDAPFTCATTIQRSIVRSKQLHLDKGRPRDAHTFDRHGVIRTHRELVLVCRSRIQVAA
jgi:hypothetical protein